jgi:phage terminase large subunit
MSFTYTTAIDKIRKLTKRKKVIPGGSSAGKTFAILAVLIDWAARNPKKVVSVVSESYPHLKKGCMRDFINIMEATSRFQPDHWNKTESTYRFQNGTIIEFFSADQPSKLRGSRRDVLYINECNNVPYEAYLELSIRTKGDIYLDYNPVASFWADQEVANEPDAETLTINYGDNEALDETIIEDFKMKLEKAKTSDYWKNWCDVYIHGKVGQLEGTIYNNWTIIDKIPDEARLLGLGIDFGYAADPTSVIAIYKLDDKFILDEVVYEKGLLNSQIAQRLKQLNLHNEEIIADSAEPKSIAELKSYGLRKIRPTDKGKDSVAFGINIAQGFDLLVTSWSTNLIKELRNYIWLKKNGVTTNQPVDDWNHGCDAFRYFFQTKFAKQKASAAPFRVLR